MRLELRLLLVILSVAAVLRAWAVGFGPDFVARPDEPGMIGTLNAMKGGEPKVLAGLVYYGGAYLYPLYGFVEVWRGIFGSGATSHTLAWDPRGILLAARIWSVFLSIATVGTVYVTGRALGGVAAGLMAAGVMGASTLAVREAHFAKADSAAAFAAATFIWAVSRRSAATWRRAVLIGAASALALATKAGAALVPVGGLALARPPDRSDIDRGGLVAGGLTFVLLALPLHWVWLSHPTESFQLARALADAAIGASPPGVPLPAHHYVVVALRYGCGIVVALLSAPALVASIRKPGGRRLLALAVLAQWIVLLQGRIALARYFLPSVPGLAVLIGTLAAEAVERRTRAGVCRCGALAVVTLVLVAEPLGNSAEFVRLLDRPDTRTVAGVWIGQHLTADAVIVTWGAPGAGVDLGRPPLAGRRALVGISPERWREVGVSHVVWHSYPLPWSSVALPDSARPLLRSLAVFDPFDGPVDRPVLESLDAFYLPLARFGGVRCPGPRIEVFEVLAEAG